MKSLTPVMLLASAWSALVFAQSSLFDRYDVNMTKWAQLPDSLPWGGLTTWVAADGKGKVVVMVRKAPYFREFTTEGKFVKAWGDEGLFGEAHAVFFDPSGSMWAVDTNDSVIYKFDADHKIVLTLGKKGVKGDDSSHDAFNRPATVGFGKNGDIFVADGYVNSRVVQFDKNGKFLRIIGGVKGSGPGQMQLVHGVVIDSKGRIIVSDSDNKRLSIFDENGKFMTTWAAPCRGGIAIAPDDTIYVSDVNAGAVAILKEGQILDAVHVEGRPHGLGIDPATLDIYTSSSAGMSPNVTKASQKAAKPAAASKR
jgi:DNA-binding beta-propeller fold protein YncE